MTLTYKIFPCNQMIYMYAEIWFALVLLSIVEFRNSAAYVRVQF